MDLKTQTLRSLCVADSKGRKKEHDMRALKRFDREELRQGAAAKRKVIWVWDKAAVDLNFWKKSKQSGVYFLCMKKENQCLERVKEREIDFEQKINEGVQWDHVVVDRRGIRNEAEIQRKQKREEDLVQELARLPQLTDKKVVSA